MNNNQKKISEVSGREQFTVNDLPGIWRIGAAALCKDKPGYAIERLMHWDTDWIKEDEMVTLVATDCRDEATEQAWADIKLIEECMKEEARVQSDMGILEKWVEMEKSQPNIFKEANERIEKQAQETMEKLRKGEKIIWDTSVQPFHDYIEGEGGYNASMYLQDESTDNMIIGEDNICPVTKQICDDECCPPGAICNISDDVRNTSESAERKEYLEKLGKDSLNQQIKALTGELTKRPTVITTGPDGIQEQHQVVVSVYGSLEEILQDMKRAPNVYHSPEDLKWIISHIAQQLQNTIDKGYYIIEGTK